MKCRKLFEFENVRLSYVLQAYQKTQRQSETPRDTEYRLFGQVTHALIEADKRADRIPCV